MTDDSRPSTWRPRSDRRRLWIVLALAAAGGAAWWAATRWSGWSGEIPFAWAKIVCGVAVAALVAPGVLAGRPAPRPGEFPTGAGQASKPLGDTRRPR